MDKATHTARVNGLTIDICLTYKRSFLDWHVSRDGLSEQCDGCGTDVAEGCELDTGRATERGADLALSLVCECGCRFPLRRITETP